MGFVRGRWAKRYINSFEDKKNFDDEQKLHFSFRSEFAQRRCIEREYPELTKKDIVEIDSYWAQFGIKIEDHSWHRMYYAVTGSRDPRFMPDDFVGLCLYNYYNDSAYIDAWRDKNMFERLLPQLRFPEVLGRRVRGRYQDESGSVLEKGHFARSILNRANGDYVIVKDARLSGHGRGVRKYKISNSDDVLLLINDWLSVDNYVVQRCVRQHEVLAAFNESSVNIVRLLTWRHGNEVDLLFAALRYGMPGEITDDCSREGVEILNVLGVDRDGRMHGEAYGLDGNIVRRFSQGRRVPSWDRMLECAKLAHLGLDNFDLVGWDFTVDRSGSPVCLEYNIQWPGTVVYQFACGPYAGEYTGELCSFLLDETNRRNYLPYYMQL